MQKKRTVSVPSDDDGQMKGISSAQSDAVDRASESDNTDNADNDEGKGTEDDRTGNSESSGTENGGDSADQEQETKSNAAGKILTAVYPILYLSRQYKVGEALPANDPAMVEAWIAAGTAVWIPAPSSDTREGQGARPTTTEQGQPGQAVSEEAI